MKKILLLIMINALSLFALGEEIHDFKYQKSYYAAKSKAQVENKVLLIMIEKHGCPNCSYMKNIVFERKPILDYINENYVAVLLNIQNHSYPKRYRSLRAPTFFFIDPRTGKELRERKIGGSRPEKFLNELTEVKLAYDNNTTVETTLTKKEVDTAPMTSVIKIVE